MSLDTYTNLQASIASWLNRSDLTSQIPDFITLTEATLRKKLEFREVRAQYTANAQTWTMPAEIEILKSIRLVTGSPALDKPLRNATPEMLADLRSSRSNVQGRPVAFTIVGRQVLFVPTPDQAYTIEAIYSADLVPLSATNATNSVLAESPNLYLYGALMEAAPFLGDDERIPIWSQKFDDAIAAWNLHIEEEKYTASLSPARLPVRF